MRFLLALGAIDRRNCGAKIFFASTGSNTVAVVRERFNQMLAGLVTIRLGVNWALFFHADWLRTITFARGPLILTRCAVDWLVWGANFWYACPRYAFTFIFVFPLVLAMAASRWSWSWAYFFCARHLSDATALIRRRNGHIMTLIAHLRGIHFTLFHFTGSVKATAFIAIRLFYLAIGAVDRWLHCANMRLAF